MAVTNGTLPPKVFRVATLITLNGNRLTDQGRSPVSVSVERIEESRRMANGTMRRFYVADKHTFSVDWSEVPRLTTATVDGGQGGEFIESLYLAQPGAVPLVITWGDGSTKTYSVFLTDYSKEYISRYAGGDIWDVSLTMEEV